MKIGKRKDGPDQGQDGGVVPDQIVLRGQRGGNTGETKATRGMIKIVA